MFDLMMPEKERASNNDFADEVMVQQYTPKIIRPDNLKAGVTHASYYDPESTQAAKLKFQSEQYDWVTLVTCEFYNPFSEDFLFRRSERAVLVSDK